MGMDTTHKGGTMLKCATCGYQTATAGMAHRLDPQSGRTDINLSRLPQETRQVMDAIHVQDKVGETPAQCDHCGGPVKEIGLVAPKCTKCGRFSISHITFLPPVEIQLG